MNYIHINNSTRIVVDLTSTIQQELDQGKSVLWLLSGGSSIEIAVNVQNNIRNSNQNLLHIGLIDERYGDVGHKYSNWHQLLMSGFSTKKATLHPILTGLNMKDTTKSYNDELVHLIKQADVKIGIFGIGADGHTSGLLPNSDALKSNELVDSYTGPDFQRITTTAHLIPILDKIFVYAVGDAKWPAIIDMQDEGSVSEVPARILRDGHDVTVYTDYKEEKV